MVERHMLRIATLLIAGLIVCPIGTTFPAWAAQNFDCANTVGGTGYVVCRSESLLALDAELHELVKELYQANTQDSLKNYGRLLGCFHELDIRCGVGLPTTETCMKQAYEEVVDRLRQGRGLPERE